MTGGSHLSARGREEAGYRFGFDFLGRGPLRYWAESRPRGPFLFLFLLFSFLFCFLYFSHNFCKDTSIQIKLLPEIFKRGAQYSKSVIKQVFK
jgi:hypothetical protein